MNHSASFLMTRNMDVTSLISLIELYSERDSLYCMIIYSEDKNEDLDHLREFCGRYTDKIVSIDTIPETDVVFVSNPYLGNIIYDFISQKSRIVYVPYGTSISDEPFMLEMQYGRRVHQKAWKIYVINEYYRKFYKKYANNGNCVNIRTIPKFDHIRKLQGKQAGTGKFVFLWNIHFSILSKPSDNYFETWSAFFAYYQVIYDILRNNENICIVARPHPLIMNGDGDILLRALSLFKNMDRFHVEISNKIDYSEWVSAADGYITDLSSMLFDLAVTGKPIITLFYRYSRKLNVFADRIFRQMSYVVNSGDELEEIMNKVANGDDRMKRQRMAILQHNNLFDLSKPACEIIAEDIERTLAKEGRMRQC